MTPHKTKLAVALVAASCWIAMACPATATAFCHPVETGDGFVALRQAPLVTAQIIGEMKAGDEVMIGQRQSGNWIEVTWWRSDDRLTKGFEKPAGKGWVNRRLIEQEC